MPLNHAEAVLSLRDDPMLATMSDDELATEVEALLGNDDPLEIALVVEEARRLGPSVPQEQPRPEAEPCRLENSCGGSNPVAANGRCMTCGANRGAVEPEALERSDTEAVEPPPSAPQPIGVDPSHGPDAMAYALMVATSDEPLTARTKAALGMTDGDMGKILGVSRPTASAYATGRLPEIIDGVRATYLKRAVEKRQAALAALDAELRQIIAASD